MKPRWLRRALLAVGVLAVAVLLGAALLLPGLIERSLNRIVEHEPHPVSARAAALHHSLEVGDLHSDSLLFDRDLLRRADRGHVDLPRLRAGNAALQVFSVVTKSPRGQNYRENSGENDQLTLLVVTQLWPPRTWDSLLERALYQAEKLHDLARRAPGELVVVQTAADLRALLEARAAGSSRVGGLLALEGAHALEGDLANVARLQSAGYRMVGLHHFFDNELGGSLHGTGKGGLSELGRAVVRELEARHVIVDLAHSSPQVVDDVLAIASRPVVVSHTGLRSVCDSPRNLDDARLQRIAARGGLIGIGYWDGAVCDISPRGVARTIARAVELLGTDHVGLGSDYDGSTTVLFDTSELAALTGALLEAGLSAEQVGKVMGGNLMRLLGEQLPAG